ncbi:MAG: hypothetical protein ACHQ7M_04450, partial [Chloroflexota bacterium]
MDNLSAFKFAEIQLALLQEQAGPHYVRNLGLRRAALHRRLDTLEANLRRRARELGEDSSLAMSELCRLLGQRTDRRQPDDPYWTADRRLWARRESDRELLESMAPALPVVRESLHRLLDGMQDIVLLASTSWRDLMGNRAALELLGYSADELRNVRLYDLIAGADFASNALSPT